jgi:F0F1-type ATP synthase assembly protein I
MSDSAKEAVQLNFSQTENEYLAATRLYFWNSKELVLRLLVGYALFSVVLFLLALLVDFSLPPWFLIILLVLGGLGLFHGFLIDLPRRYFRGDPKFRDEYNLTFTDAGIQFKTQNINASYAWSFFTQVIENDKFYLLVYGKNIASVSIIPKRAFRDSKQEKTFREMLRRNIDHKLKLSDGEREEKEYVPTSLEPPDWR